MFDYVLGFDFEEYVELDDCVCWYFVGGNKIIDDLFPNKYPEAIATTLSIEKYGENDYLVSISPTIREANGDIDYDWTDIELSINTIKELIAKANKN